MKFDIYFRAQYKVKGTHVTPLPMEDENFFLSAAQTEVEKVRKVIQFDKSGRLQSMEVNGQTWQVHYSGDYLTSISTGDKMSDLRVAAAAA